MLNLQIAMLPHKAAHLLLLIATLLFFPGLTAFQVTAQGQQQQAAVDSPRPGDVLQGVVSITGTTDVAGFRSAEVAFAYAGDTTGTWFLIQQSSKPVKQGGLATWDTTTITDGAYRLRVQVFLQDGRVLESEVGGLRVRNYTQVETSTPAPGRDTPTPTATALPDFQVLAPGSTPLPTNPAQVTAQDLRTGALRGVMVVAGLFAAAFLYFGLRAVARR